MLTVTRTYESLFCADGKMSPNKSEGDDPIELFWYSDQIVARDVMSQREIILLGTATDLGDVAIRFVVELDLDVGIELRTIFELVMAMRGRADITREASYGLP